MAYTLVDVADTAHDYEMSGAYLEGGFKPLWIAAGLPQDQRLRLFPATGLAFRATEEEAHHLARFIRMHVVPAMENHEAVRHCALTDLGEVPLARLCLFLESCRGFEVW